MAKSGMHRVSVLLAVLAVAASLDAVHALQTTTMCVLQLVVACVPRSSIPVFIPCTHLHEHSESRDARADKMGCEIISAGSSPVSGVL